MIFDDMLGILKNTGYIISFCSRFRHSKCSLIFSTQLYRGLPPIIRANAQAYIIWKTKNKKEISKLIDEFEGVLPDFEQIYNDATDKKYEFLYINLKDIKAFKNFNELLYEH